MCSHSPPSPPVCGDPLLPSSSSSSTMGERRSVGPIHSQGHGCKFQWSPRDPDRRGDWALSAPHLLVALGEGVKGNEDRAAGGSSRWRHRVCLCMYVSKDFFWGGWWGGASLQTHRRGFQGLLFSSPLVTTRLATLQITHTHWCLTSFLQLWDLFFYVSIPYILFFSHANRMTLGVIQSLTRHWSSGPEMSENKGAGEWMWLWDQQNTSSSVRLSIVISSVEPENESWKS